MKLIDAHCHLDAEELAPRLDEVLRDAARCGVVRLVTASVSPEGWEAARRLGERPEVVFALGIHPWFARAEHAERLEELRHAREQGAVAIGEIGLDRKVESPPYDLQLELFEAQLAIARDIGLPVVIHCRGAFNELIRSVKEAGLPSRGGVVHAFSGSEDIAGQCMDLGLSFSLGGTLTYRNSRKREAVLRRIYPAHLLLETDSPDIPPVKLRGEPNVPANIVHNLGAAAAILGVTEEEVAEQTTRNAERLFGFTV